MRSSVPFITIEGVDGAGKSSHMDTLLGALRQAGFDVVATREPGGTELGQVLRAQIKTAEMDARTAALIAFADRQEHLVQKILPALAEGRAVLSDRFSDSSYAYQGGGEGCDWEFLKTLERLVQQGLRPDLTLFFDLPTEVAAARRERRKTESGTDQPDKFDDKEMAWFDSVRQAYLRRVQEDPERFVTIDASCDLEHVAGQVRHAIGQFLHAWKASPSEPRARKSPRP